MTSVLQHRFNGVRALKFKQTRDYSFDAELQS